MHAGTCTLVLRLCVLDLCTKNAGLHAGMHTGTHLRQERVHKQDGWAHQVRHTQIRVLPVDGQDGGPRQQVRTRLCAAHT